MNCNHLLGGTRKMRNLHVPACFLLVLGGLLLSAAVAVEEPSPGSAAQARPSEVGDDSKEPAKKEEAKTPAAAIPDAGDGVLPETCSRAGDSQRRWSAKSARLQRQPLRV